MREIARIRLFLLDDAEYAEFAEDQVAENARQHVMAGEWLSHEGLSLAREVLKSLLADELRDAGHEFLKAARPDGRTVGWLWVAPAPSFLCEGKARKRWLSQITVSEGQRNQGYGREMLEALHQRLTEQGVGELWLRAFDWNDVARRLYSRLGYQVVRRFENDAHLRRYLANPNPNFQQWGFCLPRRF
jgi:GNAT superfamily N-acetyltransferase